MLTVFTGVVGKVLFVLQYSIFTLNPSQERSLFYSVYNGCR